MSSPTRQMTFFRKDTTTPCAIKALYFRRARRKLRWNDTVNRRRFGGAQGNFHFAGLTIRE